MELLTLVLANIQQNASILICLLAAAIWLKKSITKVDEDAITRTNGLSARISSEIKEVRENVIKIETNDLRHLAGDIGSIKIDIAVIKNSKDQSPLT
jgi:hypothetical protein